MWFVGRSESIFFRDIWDLWSVYNTNSSIEVPQDSKKMLATYSTLFSFYCFICNRWQGPLTPRHKNQMMQVLELKTLDHPLFISKLKIEPKESCKSYWWTRNTDRRSLPNNNNSLRNRTCHPNTQKLKRTTHIVKWYYAKDSNTPSRLNYQIINFA